MKATERYYRQLISFPLPLFWNRLTVKAHPTAKNLQKKDELIKKQLEKDLFDTLNTIPRREESIKHNKTVWVMWQQGFDNAPEIVKLCRQSLDKFLPKDVQVVELTDKNITDYIQVPEYIYKKYQKGIISRAHYSDVLRCMVLKEYGGMWIDSTVFLTAPLDEKIFELPFWTVKNSQPLVSNFDWSMYIMGGVNTLIFDVLSDLLDKYWDKYNVEIDYLFLDYLMDLMRENDPRINNLIDQVPVSNRHVLTLGDKIKEGASEKELDKLLQSDTEIFKLSYRLEAYSETYDYFTKEANRILKERS